MKGNIKWVAFDRLLERWKLTRSELNQIITGGSLPAYALYQNLDYVEELSPIPISIQDWKTKADIKPERLVFKTEDIERIEVINNSDLNGKDRQELGRLRNEKQKWDDSIAAAVRIGIFCKEIAEPLKKDVLTDKISDMGYHLPDTTIIKIWRSVPEEFRKKAGAPRKIK
ncbi:MAG: hypothetical protein HGJ94_21830 [Desulfosarcina sp.]|nr:hypothetical protein [Desulfosarcina sp.]MBC2742616.1 hypothetical protein [Desulfosarcina sp.]MBC2765526.1 hypothetical protein [Desulfosarcina sp.]